MAAGCGSGEDAALVFAVFLRRETCKEEAVSCDTAMFGIRTCLERWKMEMPVGLKVLARTIVCTKL